ncbi:hypothetical protein MPSEU_000426300 [Mayamaea pseudoterrestris]|nr:hypothetical protein MPSEU_000426300 [Mayamaea pseudoterrestris]
MISHATSETASSAVSDDGRLSPVLFLAKLRNMGVVVLKLGSRNKWQSRVLVASRENDESVSNNITIPKALLWLKAFDDKLRTASNIKELPVGHGGMIVSELVTAEMGFGETSLPPIPRRFLANIPLASECW